MNWIDINDQLPEDEQRVLAYIPKNKVFLPGKDLQFEIREVIVLRFLKDFYIDRPDKQEKHGLHFWQGEGNSNHFFADVTHWAPIPEGPSAV
ncbi:DUF551 domain-containing protein [Sanyastnella coralliicola]|uniref:DUF551 domain-containing protein n=1 Tax=Sanyastnella coralliicola TaxID=3069118 RepID=UPI0027BABAEB|nr:DUF551 domain-containing protein [Longitalea sp. SCSIO 12813]